MADPSAQEEAIRFCRIALRPVLGMLLRAGISYRMFADIAKSMFVDVAGREFGIRGRPTNVSRVALMTGLSRRDVAQQRKLLDAEAAPAADEVRSAARLLMGWHSDVDFRGPDGKPIAVTEEDEKLSFRTLYQRYGSADVPASTLLNELLRSGAVARQEDGKLLALTRYYMPMSTNPQALARAGSVIEDLGDTVAWNMARSEKDASRFEGRATSVRVRSEDVQAFNSFLEERAQHFLEEVDDWLMAREQSNENTGAFRMGVGVYEIQQQSDH